LLHIVPVTRRVGGSPAHASNQLQNIRET
jgi:hypothetical protein